MHKIAIDFDMSSYAYDPARPTEQAERLCFKLNVLLEEMKLQGVELRFTEDADIEEAEAYVSGLYEDLINKPQENPTLESPENIEILGIDGVYAAVSLARASWCKPVIDSIAGQSQEEELVKIRQGIEASLNQETIVYLSDGTPIYGRSGLVA